MRSHFIELLLSTATALGASSAEAKPRRVVVLDFDGPRQLADSGRSAVMSVLGEQYNIVATRTWDAARARSAGRGPQQWRQASKQAGVDAVIEGWVQAEGRHHVLTIAVRDAATGNEIDTLSVRVRDRGVSSDAGHKLAAQLDDVLSWIDGDVTAEPTPALPDVRTTRVMLGARNAVAESGDEDDDELDEDVDERPRPRRKKARRKSRDVAAAEPAEPEADNADERVESEAKPKPKREAKAEDGDTNDLVTLFGPESKEAAIVSDNKAARVPQPTPRFRLAAGGYVQSRGLLFTYDPEAAETPPEYPAQTIKGFAAQVAVYPFPHQKLDGRLSGPGFSLDVAHSVASVLPAKDETGYGDYTLTHTAWETGVHYRWPIDIVAIDVGAAFGNATHALPSDFPQSVAIPDTAYSYLGVGARIDLQVTDRASLGAGARYLHLIDTGMVTDEDWYGAGKARGVALDGDFIIPLPHRLYVRGGVEYRRTKIDFEGSGTLTEMWGVWDVVDSSIAGTAHLGVQF